MLKKTLIKGGRGVSQMRTIAYRAVKRLNILKKYQKKSKTNLNSIKTHKT